MHLFWSIVKISCYFLDWVPTSLSTSNLWIISSRHRLDWYNIRWFCISVINTLVFKEHICWFKTVFIWKKVPHLLPMVALIVKCDYRYWILKCNYHTCEPPDRRTNSPVFLGHLPISNILPNSPDFYMFLQYSPDFYMFTSQMCNLHHVHLGQGSKMQPVVFWILYTVQKSFILTSNFVLTTL